MISTVVLSDAPAGGFLCCSAYTPLIQFFSRLFTLKWTVPGAVSLGFRVHWNFCNPLEYLDLKAVHQILATFCHSKHHQRAHTKLSRPKTNVDWRISSTFVSVLFINLIRRLRFLVYCHTRSVFVWCLFLSSSVSHVVCGRPVSLFFFLNLICHFTVSLKSNNNVNVARIRSNRPSCMHEKRFPSNADESRDEKKNWRFVSTPRPNCRVQ